MNAKKVNAHAPYHVLSKDGNKEFEEIKKMLVVLNKKIGRAIKGARKNRTNCISETMPIEEFNAEVREFMIMRKGEIEVKNKEDSHVKTEKILL